MHFKMIPKIDENVLSIIIWPPSVPIAIKMIVFQIYPHYMRNGDRDGSKKCNLMTFSISVVSWF